MAYRWDIVVRNAPQMALYNNVMEVPDLDHEDGEHTYLTGDFLTPSHSIPGIPSPYTIEQREGRALYLGGAPPNWQNDVVRSIFRLWGTVEKLPVLISLSTDQTFRWVVMGNYTEAMTAMENLHGRKHEHGRLIISMSLPPGRTITLVKKEPLFDQQAVELYEDSESESERTPTQQLFHGHPPIQDTSDDEAPMVGTFDFRHPPIPDTSDEKTPRIGTFEFRHPPIPDTSDEKTPRVTSFEFHVEDTDAETGEARRAESLYPDLYSANGDSQGSALRPELFEDSDDDMYIAEDIETPEVQQPTKFSPMASPVKDTAAAVTSWASITASANPDTKVVDLKPEQKTGYRLKPVGRIPTVTRTDHNDNARLVFLFDLPSNITYADVSNAIIEGPLIKMRFGIDNNTQKRFCGVVFQHSHDALAFQKSLDEERRLSQPKRFRFIVDHARDTQEGLESAIRVMGPPVFATRRLTIVKAGFFFMFGERQLRDACDKLVGEETVQLIWLYNGGNATVVFTDVSCAVKVKNEFDRRARRAEAGATDGYAIWAGLTTTYSKDPCVVPLELKTRLQN